MLSKILARCQNSERNNCAYLYLAVSDGHYLWEQGVGNPNLPFPTRDGDKKFSDLQVMKAGLFLQTVKLLLHSLLQPLPKTQAILHQFELHQ